VCAHFSLSKTKPASRRLPISVSPPAKDNYSPRGSAGGPRRVRTFAGGARPSVCSV
jgi:hypothetical protein